MSVWSHIRDRGRTASRELSAVTHWLWTEQKDLLRATVDAVRPDRLRRVVLETNGTQAKIIARKANGPLDDIELKSDTHGELPASVAEFWPENRPRSVDVEVAISNDKVLIRKLVLPAVSDRDLDKILELRLERELPLKREHVYVDWVVEDRKQDSNRINVTLGIVRRKEVDRILDSIRRWGWRPVRVGLSTGDENIEFDFLDTLAHSRAIETNRIHRQMLKLAASITLATALLIGAQWTYERVRLADTLAVAHSQLQAQEAQQSKIKKQSESAFRLRQLMEAPAAPLVLIELTSLLPTNTWASDVEIQSSFDAQATMRMVGYTQNATELVSLIENSEQFSNVELISSSASLAEGQSGRVELSAKWSARSGDRVASAGVQ